MYTSSDLIGFLKYATKTLKVIPSSGLQDTISSEAWEIVFCQVMEFLKQW